MANDHGFPNTDEDAIHQRFRDVWMFCMIDHGVGTMPSGPCTDCVRQYAIDGPPDGEWNKGRR